MVSPTRISMIWNSDPMNTVATDYAIILSGLINPPRPSDGKNMPVLLLMKSVTEYYATAPGNSLAKPVPIT
jgi:hypothetical protein